MVQLPAGWAARTAGRSTRINSVARPTIAAVRAVPTTKLRCAPMAVETPDDPFMFQPLLGFLDSFMKNF
jgi:hypothetical protein